MMTATSPCLFTEPLNGARVAVVEYFRMGNQALLFIARVSSWSNIAYMALCDNLLVGSDFDQIWMQIMIR